MALPKKNRLKEKNDFREVFRRGKTVNDSFMLFKFVPNQLQESRFAFIVSRKVSKKAVIRNQLKRRLSELVGAEIPRLKRPVDGIFIVRAQATKESFEKLKDGVIRIFGEAKLI